MAKLKEHIIKQEEHRQLVLEKINLSIAELNEINRAVNKQKHKWTENMPDLEGKALADAEKQFDYDSWLGEHGIGE
jgi:hypothetical protein